MFIRKFDFLVYIMFLWVIIESSQQKIAGGNLMIDSIIIMELDVAIEKLKLYATSTYGVKISRRYCDILDGLKHYASNDSRTPTVVIADYYELITGKPAFQRPETEWLQSKARALFMLLDIIGGSELKRKYFYKEEYSGTFANLLVSYKAWLIERGDSAGTISKKCFIAPDFLRFLDRTNVTKINEVTVNCVLSYLQQRQITSANSKKYAADSLKHFLAYPELCSELSFDPIPLLSGFRIQKNNRLKSFYTADELKAVMNAVDRTSKWGKTIYAMMLLACVYGLRASDIRGLQISSVQWKQKKISLFQKKTMRYVELPLSEEVKFALLDYLKNVRPSSPNPHVFLRHRPPHIPYSEKVNFASKVTEYFQKAGINTEGKHHGLHSMRFSLATNLLSDDVQINDIASILGHKTIESTKDYAWADLKHLKMAALEVPEYAK